MILIHSIQLIDLFFLLCKQLHELLLDPYAESTPELSGRMCSL